MSKAAKLQACVSKRAFASREDASASGLEAYLCPICTLYHRTGDVTPIRNPVLPEKFFYPSDQSQTQTNP
jgi:hypothetical protein